MNELIQEINDKKVEAGSLCFWWIGQEGFVIKTPDLIIYIDPYLSNYGERITKGQPNEHVRMTPAPMKPEDVNHADLVLCTHEHGDHIDPDGLPVIARKSSKAKFVVPKCAEQTLLGFGISQDRICTLAGDDSLTVSGIDVYAIPAKHERFDRDEDNGYPYLSYIIDLNGVTILHAGDTIGYDGQAEKIRNHNVDLAFLPINGRDDLRHSLKFEGNFTCAEAVEFALAIRASLTIPMHYDMFTLNTADVNEFSLIARNRCLCHTVLKPATAFAFVAGA